MLAAAVYRQNARREARVSVVDFHGFKGAPTEETFFVVRGTAPWAGVPGDVFAGKGTRARRARYTPL